MGEMMERARGTKETEIKRGRRQRASGRKMERDRERRWEGQ